MLGRQLQVPAPGPPAFDLLNEHPAFMTTAQCARARDFKSHSRPGQDHLIVAELGAQRIAALQETRKGLRVGGTKGTGNA